MGRLPYGVQKPPRRWPLIAVFVFWALVRGLLIGGFWLLVLLAVLLHLTRSY